MSYGVVHEYVNIYEKLVNFIKNGDMEMWSYHEFGRGVDVYRIQEEMLEFSLEIMKGGGDESKIYFAEILEKIEEWSKNVNSAVFIPITE